MKLLIIDDHAVFRDGLAALLSTTTPAPSIIQANTVREGLALLEKHPELDLLLLDFLMPEANGIDAITEFGRRRPTMPIIVLSSSEDSADVRRALAKGALGYVPKSAGKTVLLSAIQLVMNGDVYVPPLIMNTTVEDARVGRPMSVNSEYLLTARQIEILGLLSDGHPNKAIANKLGISEKTIKVHVTSIFKILKVVNRTQAAAVARDAGLL